MADSEESSEDERKTVNLIDLDNTVVNFSQNETTPCMSSENAPLRCLLDQTIVRSGPTPLCKGGLVSEPKAAKFRSRDDTSSGSSDGRRHDDTFFRKVVVERQSDIEDLLTSFEEVIREKSVLENELRQKNEDLIEAKRQLEFEMTSSEELRSFYDVEYSALLEERDEVKRKYGQLQKDLDDGSTAFISLKVDNETLQRKCKELQKLLDDRSASSATLRAERDEANSQCEKLFLEVHRLQKQAAKVERLTKTKTFLQEQLDSLRQSCEKVETFSADDSFIKGLLLESESLKSANATLEAQLEKMHDAAAESQSVLQESQSHDIEKTLNERDCEMAMLKDNLRAAEHKLRLLKESEQQMESAKKNYLRREKEISLRIQSLQQQLDAEKQRSARLEDRVVSLENTCDAADASEAEYKNQLAALSEHIEGLQKELEQYRWPEAGAGSATKETANGLFISRSAIMETGQLQVLEAEKYQLRKQLERCQKYNRKLLEEVRDLGLAKQNSQLEHKENDSSGGGDSSACTVLRRAVSECDNSPHRPLQVSSMPNSAIDHTITSNTRTNSQPYMNRFFAPIGILKGSKP